MKEMSKRHEGVMKVIGRGNRVDARVRQSHNCSTLPTDEIVTHPKIE